MAVSNITIFGGSGFIGRYLVRRLAAKGHRIRVAVRDPEAAMFLKPAGDVGQVVPIQANLRHKGSIQRAVAGADIVINSVGILFEGGAQRFAAVHVHGAEAIAEAAAEAGARRLIHLSAIGADADSMSLYARSKAAGEARVQAAFPNSAILRPSVVFGAEDGFFNLFGQMSVYAPALPLVGGGLTKFQPVFVDDVAAAGALLATDNPLTGIVELGGPRVYSFRELLELTLAETGRNCLLLPLPFELAKIVAFFTQLLPTPPLTQDQVELLRRDNVVSGDYPGLSDLGLTAHGAEAILPSYMVRYRRGGQFSESRLG